MVVFHGHILSTIPAAGPLEWTIFMIFGTVFLFGHYGDVPLSTLDSPLLIAILLATHVLLPIVGNVRPDKVSFVHSMRYYAGNWAASHWLFDKDSGAEEKLSRRVVKSAPLVVEQMTRLYDRDAAEVLLTKGLAFRELHAHGRALNGLLPRAVDDVENYDIRDGEFQAGALVGWNFGDGHFHHKQLLDAVQERCQYEPGELRVVFLESQPIHLRRQHYCIYDAALGLIEEGEIAVADMTERQPWLDETATIPVSPARRSTSVDDVPAIA